MTADLWIVYGFLFASLYFEVFLLAAFIERQLKGTRSPAKGSGTLPTVAIVVPCFNEEKTIAGTVASLLALDYPREKFEIIVVDDGSTDNTLKIAQTFEDAVAGGQGFADEDFVRTRQQAGSPAGGKTLPARPHIRVFHKANGGKHSAMNFALERTSADIVGCLDADSVVEPGALRAMAPVFENTTVAAATPGIHVKDPKTILQHMQHVEYRLSIFNRFMLAALGSAFITPGPFSLFRASVVRELGGWRRGHATEDMEMALRVQNAGFLIANVPTAIVHTATPAKLRGLFRQRVRWTYGWLRNAVDYRHMFGNREFGNLGLVILPFAITSVFAGIYFFARIAFFSTRWIAEVVERTYATGIYPELSFDLFYFNTSALWFLVYMAVAMIVVLLCAGTMIGTNKRLPPKATPLFLLFYSFLVPLWLGTALFRAVFQTGVRWR
ncbi:MAG TPA: glycosyltransferase [Candidatus Paceibacterota bacterium]